MPLSFAAIPWDQLKNVNSLLKPEWMMFSPINGAIFSKSGVINNIGMIYQGPLYRLCDHLFNLNEPRNVLPSRTLDTSPGKHLRPKLIGKLMGTLALKKNLMEKELMEKELMEKELVKLFNESIGSEPTGELRTKIGQVAKDLSAESKNPLTYKIMSTFLWEIIQSKEDLYEYYQGLNSVDGGGSIFAADINSAEVKDSWLKDVYDHANNIEISENGPNKIEDLFFKFISEFHSNMPLEPQGRAEFKGKVFTDCGETSLRNVFKIILNRNGQYDIEILKKIQEKTGKDLSGLISFFSEFPTASSQENYQARNKWAEVVANLNEFDSCQVVEGFNDNVRDSTRILEKIIYGLGEYKKQDQCEIKGVPGNMLRVVQRLTGAKSWQDFADLVSTSSGRPFSIKNNLDHDNFGELLISTFHEGDFAWHFKARHFFLEPKQADRDQNYLEFLWKHPQYHDLISLLPNNKKKIEFLVSPNRVNLDSKDKIEKFLYARYLDNNSSVYLLEGLNSLNQKLPVKNKLRQLYDTLNSNESKIRFLTSLKEENINEFYQDELQKLIINPLHHNEIAKNLLKNNSLDKFQINILETLVAHNFANSEIVLSILDQKKFVFPPDLVKKIIDANFKNERVGEYVLSQKIFRDDPEIIQLLMEKQISEEKIVTEIVVNGKWVDYPQLIEKIINSGRVNSLLVRDVLSKNQWIRYPHLIKMIIDRDSSDDEAIATHILSNPLWKDYPEFVIDLISKGNSYRQIVKHILTKDHWGKYPQFVEKLIAKDLVDKEIINFVLKKGHFSNYPELLEAIIKKNKNFYLINTQIFSKKLWVNIFKDRYQLKNDSEVSAEKIYELLKLNVRRD